MTKAHRFKGRHPKGVEPVATLHDDGDNEWFLYRLSERDSNSWQNYKLVAARCAAHKANYWLAWSPSQLRLADSKASHALSVHMPELLSGLMAYIEFCA